MTNYNERLDEVLDNFLDGTDARLTEIGWERYAENVAEAKLDLTSLIKELVAEAKPEIKEVGKQIPGDMDSFLHNQEAIWSEQYVTEFEQNLLKALEEK